MHLGIRGRLCHPHACQDPECSQHGPEVPSLPSPAHGCSMALACVPRDGSTWPLLEFYTLRCEVLGTEHLWPGGMAFRFSRVVGLPFAHRAGMHRKAVTFFLSAERETLPAFPQEVSASEHSSSGYPAWAPSTLIWGRRPSSLTSPSSPLCIPLGM